MRDRCLVEQAQSLYKAGYRQCEISKKLNVGSQLISRWCQKSTLGRRLRNPKTYQDKDKRKWYTFDSINIRNLSPDLAKILLSFLYWCEGAKYPGTNRLEFVSSDEKMQLVFIRLFRRVFKQELDESKFRVMLQLHTVHDKTSSIKYWSRLLNIPIAQFIKPHFTAGKNSRYRHIYNGTCSLRYYDYRILLRIMGMYDQGWSQLLS